MLLQGRGTMPTQDTRKQVALALEAVNNKKAEDVALLQLPPVAPSVNSAVPLIQISDDVLLMEPASGNGLTVIANESAAVPQEEVTV